MDTAEKKTNMSMVKREEIELDAYTPQNAVTRDELNNAPRRFQLPREGRLTAGLGEHELTKLAAKTAKEVAAILECDEGRAANTIAAIKKNLDAGKKPGMMNVPFFTVKSDSQSPTIQGAIDSALGERPKSLRVQFMVDFDTTASIRYGWYRGDHTLWCYSTDTPGVALRFNQSGIRTEYKCLRRECPEFMSKQCARRGMLYLRLVDLKPLGIINPFMYVLHGEETANSLIGLVEQYAQMLKMMDIPIWSPVFELTKVKQRRNYRVPDKATGEVAVHNREMAVVMLYLRDLGEVRHIAEYEKRALAEKAASIVPAEIPDANPPLLDLGVEPDNGFGGDIPEDAQYTELDADELGPPVEMDDFSLTPQPEAKPFDMTPDNAAPAKPKARKAKEGERVCAAPDCGQYVSDKVAAYCEQSAAYFGNRIYCFDCQGKIRTKRGAK